jgi:fibronectin-binding autotransporter adhesin
MKTTNSKPSFLTGLATLVAALGLHAANLTWDADTATTGTQDGAGSWTNALPNINWWDGAANVTWNNATPDNATFGAGGTAGTVTLPSNTTNTVGNITFSPVASGSYTIAGNNSSTSKLNLSGSPTISVANGVSATMTVVLSGTSFTKSGAGLLTLNSGAPNVNSGPTIVSGGQLTTGGTAGRLLIPGDLTVNNGATNKMGANEQIADSATITVDNGTFDDGGRTETIGGYILDNNGTVLGSGIITNNGSIFDIRSGTNAPTLDGSAGLTKTTSGTAQLVGNGADSFTGPVLVSAGILQINHGGSGNGLPGVITTITSAGTLQLLHDNEFNTNATVVVDAGTFELLAHNDVVSTLVLDNGGQILNGGNTSKTLTVLTNMDFRNGLCSSLLGGGGLLVKSTAGTVTLTIDNTYTNGTLISAGILQLGDGTAVNRGQFGTGPVTNNAVIILNHSSSFTVANIISGSGSLTNLGGSPSLTAANTYLGDTTVSGGTLFVKNTTGSGTGSGTVNVQSGATFAGTGTVGGAVNIQSGGNLVPGNNAVGTLSVNGALTLSAGSSSTFQVNGTTLAQDVLVAGSSVTYGGTLTIATSGTFTAGQQFTLFSGAGAVNAGNFASLVGSPGANLAFNFTNGVLSVVSTVTALPTLNVSQSGNTLTFSWTGAFKLQSQTNTLTTGLYTNWVDYPDLSNPVGVTIDPASPSVFFRLSQ